MNIEGLVDSHGVTLAYFDVSFWHRPGIYIKDINIIFINRELSGERQKTRHIPRIRTSGIILLNFIKTITLDAENERIGT